MTADRRFKVRTVQAKNPGDLLARLHDSRPLAWVRRSDELIGWGETAAITVPAGPGQFGAAERALRGLFEAADTEDHVGLPGCGLVAFGSLTFDAARPGSVLVVPRAVMGRRGGAAWVTTITSAGQREPARDDCPPVPAAAGPGAARAAWPRRNGSARSPPRSPGSALAPRARWSWHATCR